MMCEKCRIIDETADHRVSPLHNSPQSLIILTEQSVSIMPFFGGGGGVGEGGGAFFSPKIPTCQFRSVYPSARKCARAS